MADLAKTADLVLCMVDASLGFEMETFEFLAMLQIHGFPKCIGVCSHLDFYKDNKMLRKLQRKMKKRFASETTDESRLFWMKGVKNDYYMHRDIINLARYISLIQPRILDWKKENPHIVLDRFELLTDGIVYDNDKVEIAMFGYARGGSFRQNLRCNIVGLGRKAVKDIKVLDDPCPALETATTMATEN